MSFCGPPSPPAQSATEQSEFGIAGRSAIGGILNSRISYDVMLVVGSGNQKTVCIVQKDKRV